MATGFRPRRAPRSALPLLMPPSTPPALFVDTPPSGSGRGRPRRGPALPRRLTTPNPDPDLHALDRLDGHDARPPARRRGACPTPRWSRARSAARTRPPRSAADRVARLACRVDLGQHRAPRRPDPGSAAARGRRRSRSPPAVRNARDRIARVGECADSAPAGRRSSRPATPAAASSWRHTGPPRRASAGRSAQRRARARRGCHRCRT